MGSQTMDNWTRFSSKTFGLFTNSIDENGCLRDWLYIMNVTYEWRVISGQREKSLFST